LLPRYFCIIDSLVLLKKGWSQYELRFI
jgi:hypothetical protein